MSDLQLHNQEVLDRLLKLLYSCDENVPDSEVNDELTHAAVDMQPAFRRLHDMIEQKQARHELAHARDTRTSILNRLQDVVGPAVSDIRTGVQEFINRAFSGPEQVAHYHKLEKAATDEDLLSLLDDLTRLAELRKTKDPNAPKTE